MKDKDWSDQEFEKAWLKAKGSNSLGELTRDESREIFSKVAKEVASKKSKRLGYTRLLMGLAASVIFIASIITFLPDESSVEELVYLEKSTTENQRAVLFLPDSTKVWLNGSSSITYPQQFAKEERLVSLKGEAYFEVTKDPKKPFRVQSNGSLTQVLGTAFNLKNSQDKTEIFVKEGRVSFGSADLKEHNVTLAMNDFGSINNVSGAITKERMPEAVWFDAWKVDQLTFKDEPILNVLRALEVRYNISLSVEEVQSNCTIDMTIKSQSLERVMDLLKLSLGLDYEWIDKKTLKVDLKECQ